MELILEVANPYVAEQSFETSHRFREAGGTIGRGSACAWQLPDPTRHLSSQHALVEFEDGLFYLCDLSTNGVFVNESPRSLGKGQRHAIGDGDEFVMGPFRLRASLLTEAATVASALPPSIANFFEELEASMPAAGHDELADRLGFSKTPAQPDSALSEGSLARELEELAWALDSVEVPNLIPMSRHDWNDSDLDVLDRTVLAVQRPQTAKQQAAASEPARSVFQQASVSSSKTMDPSSRSEIPENSAEKQAVDAFLQSTGLGSGSIRREDLVRVMSGCGQMLRGSIKSLMEILTLRTQQKNRYRLGMTLIKRQENNPLKYSVNEVQAIKQLVVDPQPECLSTEQALQQSVVDLIRHIEAIESAYQELIREVIDFVAGEEETIESARRGWMDRRAQKRALQKRLATLRDEDIMRREFFEHRFSKHYQDAVSGVLNRDREEV